MLVFNFWASNNQYVSYTFGTHQQPNWEKKKLSNIRTWIKVIVFNPCGQAWFNLPQHWESLIPNICYYFWGKVQDLLKVARLSSSCDDSQQCQRTFDCTPHLCAAPGLSSHQRGRTMLRWRNTHMRKHKHSVERQPSLAGCQHATCRICSVTQRYQLHVSPSLGLNPHRPCGEAKLRCALHWECH